MVKESIERGDTSAPLLLEAAKLVLESLRWTTEMLPGGTSFHAWPVVGDPLVFASNCEEVADVLVINDAYGSAGTAAQAKFINLNGLAALRSTAGTNRAYTRLGRDLVFPTFGGAFESYAKEVAAEFQTQNQQHDPSETEWPVWQIVENDGALVTIPWADIESDSAVGPRRVLFAFDAAVDRTAVLLNRIFLPKAARVSQSRSMSIPLFILAAEVRAVGFAPAVHRACRSAIGATLPAELLALLLNLGYFHLCIPDGEVFRTAADLDPNSEYFGDLLDGIGDLGGFTLACDREFIFHTSSFPNTTVVGPSRLKLAGAFFVSQGHAGFALFDACEDISSIDPLRMHGDVAATIATLAEGRLSIHESGVLMGYLACAEYRMQGQGITVAQINEELLRLLCGERLRPANVAFARSAVLNAGLLRVIGVDLFLFKSSPLCLYLVTEAVLHAIKANFLFKEDTALRGLLQIQGISQHVFHKAVGAVFALYGEPFAAQMPLFVETLHRRVRAGDGAASGEHGGRYERAAELENILRLAITAASIGGRMTLRSAKKNLTTAYGVDPAMEGLALPQFSFVGFDLDGWRFSDCILRNALFYNCNLENVKFNNSLVSGAVFIGCRFNKNNQFQGSDFSGVVIKASTGVSDAIVRASNEGGRMDGTIWTTASIEVAGKKGEVDMLFDAFKNSHQNISFSALQIISDRGADAGRMSAPWPKLAAETFFRAVSGARSVHVMRPNEEHDDLVLLDKVTAYWPRVFESTAASPDGWVSLTSEAHELDAQLFAGLTSEGELWTGVRAGERLTWHRLPPVGHARELAVKNRMSGSETGDLDLWVAVSTTDQTASIRLFDVQDNGLVKEVPITDIETCPAVTALRWINPVHAGFSACELLVGTDVGLFSLVQRGEGWALNRLALLGKRAPIEAIGFAEGQNLIVACIAGGLAVGYRHIAAGQVQESFKFKSSFGQFLEAVPLNHYGQLLMVGKSGGSQADILWALLQPSGNLVATVPLETEGFRATESAKLHRDRAQQKAWNSVAAADVISALARLRPAAGEIHVSPRSSREIELILTGLADDADGDERPLTLPESFDDDLGTHFRTITITIDEPSEGEAGAPRQLYLDAMLDVADISLEKVRIKLLPNFRERISRKANVNLSIAYLPGEWGSPILGQWDFGLIINWEDNPFRHDGFPVTGDEYFGFADQSKSALNKVLSPSPQHQIIEACRRAGKTSFVRELVRMIQDIKTANYVAAVVSGEMIKSSDWNLMRVLATELRSIGRHRERSSYTQLAEWIDSGKGARDTRGDIVEYIGELARYARYVGFERPFILCIDEWGYLAQGGDEGELGWKLIGQELTARADKLAGYGVNLILTSVPGNFHATTNQSYSGDWRYFSPRRECLGRLEDESMTDLIRKPLLKRGFAIGENEEKVIKRLASRAPHDANIIMHHAFNAALNDPGARQANGTWQIQMHHVLRRVGDRSDIVNALVAKYDVMQNFLFGKLSNSQRKVFIDWAGPGGVPTLEDPHGGAPAQWDIEDIPVPALQADDVNGCMIFGEAGFREPFEGLVGKHAMMQGPSHHKLWIPWGLAESIRRFGSI